MEAELYRSAMIGSIAQVHRTLNWWDQQTPTQNNILHLHVGKSPLLNMRYKNKRYAMVDSEFIQYVLNDHDGYWLLWNQNSNGDTPLHLAARFGHSIAVKAFLKRAKKVYHPAEEVTRLLSITNNEDDTALHEAARSGDPEVVRLLVEANPYCSSHTQSNKRNETPIYLAAERGCKAAALSILRVCSASDLAYRGPCGRTALHAAVENRDSELVKEILEKERSLMRIPTDEGLTSLHCAAAEIQSIEVLKILLYNDIQERTSSTTYIQDNIGRTPLHIAMLRRNRDALDLLIKSSPDCIEIVDYKGQNVIHYAAKWAFEGVIKWFKSQAPNFDKYINDKDKEGNTPLHVFAASISRNPDLPFVFKRLQAIVRNYPSINFRAFDQQNRTVGDILHSFHHSLDIFENPILQKFPRGRRHNTYEEDNFDFEKALTSSGAEWDIEAMKKAAESRLIVAALIATVSFTAGFTVPGGLDQNAGKSMGMPVLRSKEWFKVFMVSDGIAFTASILAILYYFLLVSTASNTRRRFRACCGLCFNSISLGALMIAFVAAVCAISPNWLGYLTIAFAVLFFLIYLDLIAYCVKVGRFVFTYNHMMGTKVLQ